MPTKPVPSIPPRPSRSPNTNSPPKSEMPKIPPRPPGRRPDRSVSPSRDSYAPSPLNDLPGRRSSIERRRSNDASGANVPSRPPSVTLPSLGQEGMEYAEVEYLNKKDEDASQDQQPAQTRNVNHDLHLHAPRPSLPTASAKAQVQTVTRTDSQQAAAAGFGKAVSLSNEDTQRYGRSAHKRTASPNESSTASTDHRASLLWNDENGIPEIGQRVPMDPNAGDVQAPSPAPFRATSPGPNTSTTPQRTGRHHHRTKSGREASLPPGSYGLHGHGTPSNDRFEKAWYDKHPDELAREEQGQYGPSLRSPRPDWALSSEDLNKIVRRSANKGHGLGTSTELMGTPEEQVGYIATEELASRFTSPPSPSHVPGEGSPKHAAGSPLHKSHADVGKAEDESVEKHEAEDVGVIHIDEPLHHQHHPDGFAPAPDEPEPHGAHSLDENVEAGDQSPILAADEREPGAEFLQPAISPTFENRSSGILSPDQETHAHDRSPGAHRSRPSSRPSSLHGSTPSLPRFGSRGEEHEDMYTPLEDVEEYEPLFPEDEEQKPGPAAERFKKRPEHGKQRFPSQDIWENAPDSLQLEATVSTPDVPSKDETKPPFETLEQEAARSKHAVSPPSAETPSHLDDEKPVKVEHKQRFPSKDIWEDAPESQQLVTTVQTPEQEEEKSASPVVPAKPSFPALPTRPSRRPGQPAAGNKVTSLAESKKPPSIPDRPKPQLPARPAKPVARGSDESLTKTTSASSTDSAPPPIKAKPAIPTRPAGSKIAALKAGFVSDLEKRLKLGPQGPPPKPQEKEVEEPVEKAPLSDARKGRARGPARRKPAVTAAAAPSKPSAAIAPVRIPVIKLVNPWDVFQIGDDGFLTVGGAKPPSKTVPAPDASITPSPEKDEVGDRPSEIIPQATPDQSSQDTTSKLAEVPEAEEPTIRDSTSTSKAEPTLSVSSGDDAPEPAESEPSDILSTQQPAETSVSEQKSSIPDTDVEQKDAPDVEDKIKDTSLAS
ncbi:hypothetical protein AJ80_00950 [Polytolypa hystricis UAMH7299]|uniref:Altered inheritance of mitochondria protein 21 n=1 Tax=Polytolypa hystricis (strain UAMH7299) TaxID=1447883 RepID=A0A2B7Z2K2_POLH7|nr:hypothetical protein AJ80_00950 [Polytolypa hystricis UAMH7299]